jgi:hypothetical protein
MSDEEDDFLDEHHGPRYPTNGPVTFSALVRVLEMIASSANGNATDTIRVCDIEAAIQELES